MIKAFHVAILSILLLVAGPGWCGEGEPSLDDLAGRGADLSELLTRIQKLEKELRLAKSGTFEKRRKEVMDLLEQKAKEEIWDDKSFKGFKEYKTVKLLVCRIDEPSVFSSSHKVTVSITFRLRPKRLGDYTGRRNDEGNKLYKVTYPGPFTYIREYKIPLQEHQVRYLKG